MVKFIGKEYLTLTGFPFCFPGIHLGDFLMTLSASSSKGFPMLLSTLKLVNFPSFSIIKPIITFPWASIPGSGHFKFLFKNPFSAFWPPGNVGSFSNGIGSSMITSLLEDCGEAFFCAFESEINNIKSEVSKNHFMQ